MDPCGLEPRWMREHVEAGKHMVHQTSGSGGYARDSGEGERMRHSPDFKVRHVPTNGGTKVQLNTVLSCQHEVHIQQFNKVNISTI